MRRKKLIWVALIGALFLWGCSDDDGGQCRSVYCDDSGCYACDPDSCHCWEIENSPCEEGCAADEFCTDQGICAQVCEFDGDCAEGEWCLPEGYCGPRQEPEAECEVDDDCGAGLICEDGGDGVMICVSGCRGDEDCQDGYVCNPECHRCVPEENPVCGDTKSYCDTSEECGADRTCTATGKCVYECTESTDCPYSQVCGPENLCIHDPDPNHQDACVFSSDCADMAMCQDLGCMCVNTYCHKLCDSREDCGSMEICDMGVCVANYRPEN